MQTKEVVQTSDRETDEVYVDLGSLAAYTPSEVDRARRGETVRGVRLA